MKVFSTHFVLKGKSDYKDLAPVFPDILKALLSEIGQMPEEEEILQMFIEMNMVDLERNRKPEGYNRKGKMRLIFPIDRKEFYLKTYNKSTDMSRMADLISGLLNTANVKFEILHNDRTDFD
ncbi:MAG: hypothetical protein FWG96_02440 [Methanomassiliicoccaceae archaeon]|nr:hypothetical protein [Methanomassiliicoccaceae archaeon]